MGDRTRRVLRRLGRLIPRLRFSGAWRTYVEARVVQLDADARQAAAEHPATVSAIRRNLTLARYYGAMRRTLRDWLTGRAAEGAWFNVNTASAQLLLVQPPDTVRGRIPEVLATVRSSLPAQDPRRLAVERLAVAGPGGAQPPLEPGDRELLASALQGASFISCLDHGRVRRFRNMVILGSLLLTVVVGAFIVIAALRPAAVPLCFPGDGGSNVCPAGSRSGPGGGDVPLIGLLGLIGATLATSRALSTREEVAGRYSPALALALLKAPTGVTTAIIGVLTLNSGFVPGVTAAKTQAGILFWALVFGYAQQLLTGLLDQRAAALQKSASPLTPAPGHEER